MAFEYQKLRGRIIEKFGTQDAFADALEKDRVFVSRKMNGNVQFSKADISKWCELLDIELSEIGDYFFA